MDLKRISYALPQSSGDGKVCKCVCVEWEETKKNLFGDNRRQRGGEEMADGNQTAVGDSSLGELTLTGSA